MVLSWSSLISALIWTKVARREVRNITYMHLGRKLLDLAAIDHAKYQKSRKSTWFSFFGSISAKNYQKTQIQIASNQTHLLIRIPRGLMARILSFHPRGPGSIPGVGEHFIFIFTACLFFYHLVHFFSWPYWKSLMYKRVKLKLCTFYKLPQVYIQSNITPFIAREDCQIIPDTPLVITPPLCHAGLENPNRNFTMPY